MADLNSLERKLVGMFKLNILFETLSGMLVMFPKNSTSFRIGGADARPMTSRKKYPISPKSQTTEALFEVPFVPGSSVKGRMRSLLELAKGKTLYTSDKKIWMHARNEKDSEGLIKDILDRCEIDEVFGSNAISFQKIENAMKHPPKKILNKNDTGNAIDLFRKYLAPTRLIVGDFYPTQSYVNSLLQEKSWISLMDFLMLKDENSIDRITSAANPRSNLVVKPGVEFEGEMKLLVFDIDLEDCNNVKCWLRNLRLIGEGLSLVEETYIGSSGSRGYGKVKIKSIKVEFKEKPGDEWMLLREFDSPDKLANINLDDVCKDKLEVLCNRES